MQISAATCTTQAKPHLLPHCCTEKRDAYKKENCRHTSYKKPLVLTIEVAHFISRQSSLHQDKRRSWMVRSTSSHPPSSTSEFSSPRKEKEVIRKLKETQYVATMYLPLYEARADDDPAPAPTTIKLLSTTCTDAPWPADDTGASEAELRRRIKVMRIR